MEDTSREARVKRREAAGKEAEKQTAADKAGKPAVKPEAPAQERDPKRDERIAHDAKRGERQGQAGK